MFVFSKINPIFVVLNATAIMAESTMTTPFLPLQKELEVIQQSLAARALLTVDGPKQPEFLQLINRSGYLITVHDVEFYRPVCINNGMKLFYGFEQNVLQGMDHFYYLKTIHVSTYSTLVESIAFFRKDRPGYLNLKYKLLDHRGEWVTTIGASRAIIRDERGKPKIAITVMERAAPDAVASKSEHIALLTAREREILGLLCAGFSKTEIADKLFISLNTVSTHIKNSYRKLGIGKFSELVLLRDQFNF